MAIGDLILVEVVQGFRQENDVAMARQLFRLSLRLGEAWHRLIDGGADGRPLHRGQGSRRVAALLAQLLVSGAESARSRKAMASEPFGR